MLLALAGSAQAASGDARDWITRMNQALATRNYDGVVTRRVGDTSQVFRIVHRVKDGETVERVVSTDGSGYEQKRKGSTWAEFFPDKRFARKATRHRSFGFIPAINGLNDESERYYIIADGGRVRLLGRDAQLIRIEPRDDLRYGYRIWLDAQSALPLKLQRLSHGGAVIKEIGFVTPPQMPEDISDDQLKVEVDLENLKRFRWVDLDLAMPMHTPQLKRGLTPRKKLLPAGYHSRIFTRPEEEARASGPRARFVVSDGVTWAEVFLTPAICMSKPGASRVFSSQSYTVQLDGACVTVVGELPESAARGIAEAVGPE
jgi:sigma-E factor negative regulatory protein RseB